VTPGRVLVRANLPSGEILEQECQVEPGKDVEVVLKAEESPREWMAWPRFLAKRSQLLDGWEASLGTPAASAATLLDRTEVWITRGPKQVVTVPLRSFGHGEVVEGSFASVELHIDSLPGTRAFLHLAATPQSWLVSLPVPWLDAHTGAPVHVQVLLRDFSASSSGTSADPTADSAGIGVIVKDPRLGSAIGYLRVGDDSSLLTLRSEISTAAKEALELKAMNPLAAAAGAYLLIRLGGGDLPMGWVSNLARRFEWLPDGAIIEGWCHLRDSKTAAARESFLSAARRGVPFFTEGIRILYENLAWLHGSEPGEGKKNGDPTWEWVSRVASLARPTRVFASLLSDKEALRGIIQATATVSKRKSISSSKKSGMSSKKTPHTS
jgi:hypothetical protein